MVSLIMMHTCNSWIWDCRTISFPSRAVLSSANSSLSNVMEVRADSWAMSWVCDQTMFLTAQSLLNIAPLIILHTWNSWIWDFIRASSSSKVVLSSTNLSLSDATEVRVDSLAVSWVYETEVRSTHPHIHTSTPQVRSNNTIICWMCTWG